MNEWLIKELKNVDKIQEGKTGAYQHILWLAFLLKHIRQREKEGRATTFPCF